MPDSRRKARLPTMYNDFDINLTHLPSLVSNAVITVPCRAVYVTLLRDTC